MLELKAIETSINRNLISIDLQGKDYFMLINGCLLKIKYR